MKVKASPVPALPKEALDFFRKKKLTHELDLDVTWREEHARAFKVAGVSATDLLEAIRAEVDRALAEGLTLKQFADQLEEVAATLGWKASKPGKPPWRLRVIYDTNMRVARAAGQWARIQRTKEARPYLVYELGPAEKHRPLHESWAGTTLPVDDPWWDTHMTPNGYMCRCRVRQVTTREAERIGISEAAPAGAPDTGWDTNPGKTTS